MFKKIFLTSLLGIAFLTFPSPTHAQAWPDIIGHTFGVNLQQMYEKITALATGTLKNTISQQFLAQVNQAILEVGYTNFQNIPAQAQQQSELILDQQLTSFVRGASSSLHTSSGGFIGSSTTTGWINSSGTPAPAQAGETLLSQIELAGQAAIRPQARTYTADAYCADVSSPFSSPGCFSSILEPQNNPVGTYLNYTAQKRVIEEQLRETKLAEAIANDGVNSLKDPATGEVLKPGSSYAAVLQRTEAIGIDLLTNAQSPEELTAALANNLFKRATDYATMQAQQVVSSQINRAVQQVNQGITEITREVTQGLPI